MEKKQDRAKELIEKLQADAREEAEVILASAREQAAAIKEEAYRNARLKVHEVVESLRERENLEMARERARFETERRQWHQSNEMEALSAGLTHLKAALVTLWAEKDSRERWFRSVLATACERLPVDEWWLEHPVDFPDNERVALLKEISDHTDAQSAAEEESSLLAGVRIYAGTACVDGSIDAILADKERTSAQFLSILLKARTEGAL